MTFKCNWFYFGSKIAASIYLRLEPVAGVPVAEVDDGDGGAGHVVAGHALAHQHRLLRQVFVQRWKAEQFTEKVVFMLKMIFKSNGFFLQNY